METHLTRLGYRGRYATRKNDSMDELALQVADKAECAVDQLRERSSDALNYTESSLSVVEEMLAEAANFVDEMPAEQIDALVNMLGSYILEVGRRQFGGKYYWHDDRNQPVLVVGEPECKIAILTFDKVRGRVSGDEADNIPFFYDGFASRARSAEPGTDVLYV